jgi:hypothetical protein
MRVFVQRDRMSLQTLFLITMERGKKGNGQKVNDVGKKKYAGQIGFSSRVMLRI